MQSGTKTVLLIAGLLLPAFAAHAQEARELFEWKAAGDLQAAGCVGVANGALVLVGDSAYGLDPESLIVRAAAAGMRGAIRAAGAREEETVCLGDDLSAASFCLRDGAFVRRSLPTAPGLGGSAVAGSVLYVAGASKEFWALDLVAGEARWEALEPIPGPARGRAAAGALGGAFHLFGGVGPDERPLPDAYRYHPDEGWERLADLPADYMPEPGATVAMGASHLLAFGREAGADPEGQRTVMAYHSITDTWARMGTAPPGGAVVALGEDLLAIGSGAVYRGVAVRSRGDFGLVNYIVLGTYFLVLVGMGFYFMGRERSDIDYFLASKRIPWWAAGISIFGTQLSAITFMAIPATAFATDWVYILGQATIVLLAPVVIFVYLPFFRRLEVTTAYEYLERRFNVAVRLFASAAFVLLQLGRMGIVLFLPAIALSAATGMSVWAAVLLMGLLSTLYTTLGGIEAVIWSDVLQVVVLMGGALLSLVLIASSVEGGASGLVATAAAHGKFHAVNLTWDVATASAWVVVVGWTLSNLVPYTADQTVVQRYLTTQDEAAAARSIWTNAALTIPAGVIFFGLGTALFVFFRENAATLEPTLSTDAILPLFIVQQLPVGVAGLLIAGIFAASMSSLDSSLNSVSTALVTDWYRRLVPETAEAQRLLLARRLTLALGIAATGAGLVLASYEITSLWDAFLELLGLLGGSLAGLFALGIFTRRAHAFGALAGAAVSAIALYLVKTLTEVHFFLYAGGGIVTCFAVGYLVSVLLPRGRSELSGLTVYTMHPRPAA